MQSSSVRLWIFLSIMGLILWFSLVDGPFTRDEDHHLVAILSLQHRSTHLPVPASIPMSIELASFNAGLEKHSQIAKLDKTLLISRVPPWYAVLAYPFAALGWSYLFLLNILAYLLAGWLVFLYTRRYATQPYSPWLACLVFLLGSYTLEYAQAVWPHMLSVCLCLGAAYASARTRDNETLWWACLAGLLVGLATGIRYQNAVWCAAIGLGIFFGSPRRFKSSFAYLAGVAGPIFFNSWMNFLRFQFWNPISKGRNYLSSSADNFQLDLLLSFWARVFDFSAAPSSIFGQRGYISLQPESGAYVISMAVRKAFVQSIPWVLISLVVLLWVWGRRKSTISSPQKREIRAQSIVVFLLMGAFTWTSIKRYGGLCFNERYFLELIPLVAITLVWAMESISFRWKALLGGVLLGTGLVFSLFLLGTLHPLRLWLVLKLPLVFSALALGTWWLARTRPTWARWTWGIVGLCLGWSFAIHLSEDVRSSRYARSNNTQRRLILERLLPKQEPSVLFAYGGAKDAAIPLRLSRGLMLVDPWLDDGRDSVKIARAYLHEKHRVFMLLSGMYPKIIRDMLKAFSFRTLYQHRWLTLVELKERVHRPKPRKVGPNLKSR